MALLIRQTTTQRHRHVSHFLHHHRTFIEARVKWVRDPYLDYAVEKEKNLKQLLSLKTLILSTPSQTMPLSITSSHKHPLQLPTTATNFFQKYPSVFRIFHPPIPLALPHVKLTPKAIILHKEESQVLNSPHYRKDLAYRVAKLLMLTKSKKLPLLILDKLQFDLGLPYILSFLPDFPDYFQICDMGFKDSIGVDMFGLELVSWMNDLALSVMQKRAMDGDFESDTGMPIKISMNLPRGFDLRKKVRAWVNEWQKLPYISPYEDAFFLPPNGDQAEKWAMAVLHELMHLLVSKKTEKENVLCLGDYLGFGMRFKKALVHYPGIFYVSNKIRMQTVVLREGYKKDFLAEKHLLMCMRYRYIHLMNQRVRGMKQVGPRSHERDRHTGFSGEYA